MTLTYNDFIEKKYLENEMYRKLHPDFPVFKSKYVAAHGFSEWLEGMRGTEITKELAINIAETFISHARRTTPEIKGILCAIARQYEVELPAEPGLLTDEYWLARFPENQVDVAREDAFRSEGFAI